MNSRHVDMHGVSAAEEYFTSRSMLDVKELKENHPEFALVLEVDNDKPPLFSDLAYNRVPVHDLQVGSYILVRAGEVCIQYFNNFPFSFDNLLLVFYFFVISDLAILMTRKV